LRAAAADGGLVYFADDGHWSARGHDVVADVLARAAPRWLSLEARR
jgi:hypothetical protein